MLGDSTEYTELVVAVSVQDAPVEKPTAATKVTVPPHAFSALFATIGVGPPEEAPDTQLNVFGADNEPNTI